MKKRALLLCAALALCLTACGQTSPAGSADRSDDGPVRMVNPIISYESLETAEEAIGYTVTVPEINGYPEHTVQIIGGNLLQLVMLAEDGSTIIIRKSIGDEDVSGDYNLYSQTAAVNCEGREATFRGDDDMVSTASWTADGFSYAVLCEGPVTRDVMTSLVSQIS